MELPLHRKAAVYIGGGGPPADDQRSRCLAAAERRSDIDVVTVAEDEEGCRDAWCQVSRLREQGAIDVIVVADRSIIVPPEWLYIAAEDQPPERGDKPRRRTRPRFPKFR